MTLIKRLYYILTAYVPRALPTTAEEFEAMWQVMLGAYGVPDALSARALVAGHVMSAPAIRIRMPWGNIANAAKRITVNTVANAERGKIQAVLHAKLQKEIAEYAAQNPTKESEQTDVPETSVPSDTNE